MIKGELYGWGKGELSRDAPEESTASLMESNLMFLALYV